jgi:septal ring factor EnvC (AmiA/AmiB activator)
MGRLVDNELYYCDDYGMELKAAKCWRTDIQCHENCVLFNSSTRHFYCDNKPSAKNWLEDFKNKQKQIEAEKEQCKRKEEKIESLHSELIKLREENSKMKYALSATLTEKKLRKTREKKVKE